MPEPLLCICGIGGDAECWEDLRAALDVDVDLRPMVAHGESIAEMARHVLACAPERFALAGHSMGGYVALAILHAAPDRVARLALINTAASADTPEQSRRRAAGIARVEAGGFADTVAKLAPLTVGEGVAPAMITRVAAMLTRAGETRYLREQRATAARPDRLAMLPHVAVPTLVVGAQQDRIVDPAASQDLADAIPMAKLVMLSNCGHMAPMEAPDALAAAMAAWLKA